MSYKTAMVAVLVITEGLYDIINYMTLVSMFLCSFLAEKTRVEVV